MLQLFERTPLSGEQRDYIETLHQSGQSLLTIVNDILDLSKIEANQLQLEDLDVDLEKCISSTVRLLGNRAEAKGTELRYEIDDAVPAHLIGDSVRLQQILTNLIGNAIKFIENGVVRVEVLVAERSDDEVVLQFAVHDTGIGISKANQAHIFKPFGQAEVTTARNFGGTGLGLSICTQFVRMMNGAIWLESELGEGSSFFFTCRLTVPDEARAASGVPTALPPSRTERLRVTRDAGRGDVRILLAEDNPINQKVAQRLLAELGYGVDIVEDGSLAVARVRERHYDIVLMDIQMPVLGGLEATRQIRAQVPEDRQPIIIAMTAGVVASETETCLAAGMDDFLAKPVLLGALAEILRHWHRPQTVVSSPDLSA